MSDLPTQSLSGPQLRVAPDLDFAPAPSRPFGSSGRRIDGILVMENTGQSSPRPLLAFIGLLLLVVGVALGTISQSTWITIVTLGQGVTPAAAGVEQSPASWLATKPWTGPSAKWIASIVLGLLGLSCQRGRALSVVVTAAQFAVTAYTCDLLIDGKLRWLATTAFGNASLPFVLPIVSAVFGYIVHAGLTKEGASAKGTVGLLIVAAAALGTVHGWYNWTPLIDRLGTGAADLMKDWGAEAIWATVLVLTAIGVASSRTKPVFFLVALMLGCLAWYCISSGMTEIRSFPSLATADHIPSVEHISYKNVDPWHWVVAGELVVLAIVLAHMSLGMGILNIAFALLWMFGGLTFYNSVSNMSLVRALSEGAAIGVQQRGMTPTAPADPLAGFGLPVETSPPGARPSAARTSDSFALPEAQREAMQRMQRPIQVREITPLVWMFSTAVLAGIFAVAGIALMTPNESVRIGSLCAVWLTCGVLCTALYFLWPKGSASFEGWLAAFRYSRYHTGVYWAAFFASAGVAGIWALRPTASTAAWVHASAAAILLGTCLSLGAAAILIAFGNFPKLPAWVYIVMTIGQSSLMWALLMHQSYRTRRAIA